MTGNLAAPLDVKALADDYAKRIGWPNKYGMQVASPSDIAKALVAFHRECEAARPSEVEPTAVKGLRSAALTVLLGCKPMSINDTETTALETWRIRQLGEALRKLSNAVAGETP